VSVTWHLISHVVSRPPCVRTKVPPSRRIHTHFLTYEDTPMRNFIYCCNIMLATLFIGLCIGLKRCRLLD